MAGSSTACVRRAGGRRAEHPFSSLRVPLVADDPVPGDARGGPGRVRRSRPALDRFPARQRRCSRPSAPGRSRRGRCSSSSTSSRSTSYTTRRGHRGPAHGLRGRARRRSSTTQPPVNVLLSLREDAWAKLDRFEGHIPALFATTSGSTTSTSTRPARRSRGRSRPGTELLPAASEPYEIEPALVRRCSPPHAAGSTLTGERTAPAEQPATGRSALPPTRARAALARHRGGRRSTR